MPLIVLLKVQLTIAVLLQLKLRARVMEGVAANQQSWSLQLSLLTTVSQQITRYPHPPALHPTAHCLRMIVLLLNLLMLTL